jgi:hypothetical protein
VAELHGHPFWSLPKARTYTDILIAASILAARKLAQMDAKPSPAREAAIADSIKTAERIMQRIDSFWPERKPF